MEINLNNLVQNSNPAVNNSAAGVAAPINNEQRADLSVTRVVSGQESAHLENQAASSDQKRFESVRSTASRFVDGKNKFLNDTKFTIYGASNEGRGIDFTIRFTDLSSGAIEVQTEQQIYGSTGGGDLVSGQV